jgi:hypothetical protein
MACLRQLSDSIGDRQLAGSRVSGMKTALIALLWLIVAAVGVAQSIPATELNGRTPSGPEQVIARIIDSGMFEGHDQKVIGWLGDAAAVIVTKHLSQRHLGQADIDMTLIVLVGAFADPSFVRSEADRQPRTTLLVLRYLELSTDDPKLKTRIADAKKYIEDHCVQSIRRP